MAHPRQYGIPISRGGTETQLIRGLNLLGTVVNLTDSSGNPVRSYDYDAFGVEKNPSDADSLDGAEGVAGFLVENALTVINVRAVN